MNPRVLHVDTATELRGGQRQLGYLLEHRPGDGWAGPPGAPLAGLIGRGPDVAMPAGLDPRGVIALARAARRWDLVAAHTPHAHQVAQWARVAGDFPLVVHRRVDFAPRHPARYRAASAVVAVSAGVARVLAAAGVVENVVVVHDGVGTLPDAGPTPAPDAPRPWLTAVGALVPHKGHRHLVEAMRTIPGTLWILGEGPLRAALERHARDLGLGARVRLPGTVAPIGAWLRAVDAVVHPSVEEGFGQVVVEALAVGARVVATRAGGLPEALGEAGWLVDVGSAEALAAGVRAALEGPDRDGAVAHAARFDVARMVARTVEVYGRVAAVFKGSGARAR